MLRKCSKCKYRLYLKCIGHDSERSGKCKICKKMEDEIEVAAETMNIEIEVELEL